MSAIALQTLSNPQDELVIEFDPMRLLSPEKRLVRRSAASLNTRNHTPPSAHHQHVPRHARKMQRIPKRWDVSWTAVDPDAVGKA
jgi:hypothetical protein